MSSQEATPVDSTVSAPRFRVLLVGHGRWGAVYARALSDAGVLAGIVVATTESQNSAGNQWNVPVWTGLKTAILAAKPDGIAILSSSQLHARHLVAAVSSAIPAMTIRPATVAPKTAETLHAYATRQHVPILAGHEMAWVRPVPQLNALLTSKNLRPVQSITLIAEGPDNGGPANARPMPEDAGTNLAFVYETAMHDLITSHALNGRSAVISAQVRGARASFAQPRLDATTTHANGIKTHIRWNGDPSLPFRRATIVTCANAELRFEAKRGESKLTITQNGATAVLRLQNDAPSDQAAAVVQQLLRVLDGAPPDHDLLDAATVQRGTRTLVEAVAAFAGLNQTDAQIYGPPDDVELP